jgi:hypothetical protein
MNDSLCDTLIWQGARAYLDLRQFHGALLTDADPGGRTGALEASLWSKQLHTFFVLQTRSKMAALLDCRTLEEHLCRV